jgi:hypothetical protein
MSAKALITLAFLTFAWTPSAQAWVYEQPAARTTHYAGHWRGHVGSALPSRWGEAFGDTGLRRGLSHAFRGVLSAACALAAHMGGPCGCYASERVFGHSVRELWLASNWLKFPRTHPHAGAVAVWPGRHVALVVADAGNGNVVVDDSWNHQHVTRAPLYVEPR